MIRYVIILTFLYAFLAPHSAFAGSVTMNTYYPSPTGKYRDVSTGSLKITEVQDPGTYCDSQDKAYNIFIGIDGKVYACNASGGLNQEIVSENGWAYDGGLNPPVITLNNNVATLVGLGVTPVAGSPKLDVAGVIRTKTTTNTPTSGAGLEFAYDTANGGKGKIVAVDRAGTVYKDIVFGNNSLTIPGTSDANTSLFIGNYQLASNRNTASGAITNPAVGNSNISLVPYPNGGYIGFYTSATAGNVGPNLQMVITPSGNTGIGINPPTQKLDVGGTINSTAVTTGNITSTGNVAASGNVSANNVTATGTVTGTGGIIIPNGGGVTSCRNLSGCIWLE